MGGEKRLVYLIRGLSLLCTLTKSELCVWKVGKWSQKHDFKIIGKIQFEFCVWSSPASK